MNTLLVTINGIALSLLSVGLVLAGLRLKDNKSAAVAYLTLYLTLGVLAYGFILANMLNLAPIFTGFSYDLLMNTALLAMTMAFGAVILSFLHAPPKLHTSYLAGAAVTMALWLLLAFNLWDSGVNTVTTTAIVTWGGWLGALGTAYVTLFHAYQIQTSAKHLNRLRYLLIAATLHAASGVMLLVSPATFAWAGTILLIFGAGLTSYITLSYRTPDFNRLIGQALHFIITTILIATLFYLGLAATIIVSRNTLQPVTILTWAVITAIALAVITPLLWKLIDRSLNRIVFGAKQRDEREIVRHFSRSISSALDMQRLGDILTSLMAQSLDVEQGLVLINERGGTTGITLKPLSAMGIGSVIPMRFAPDSLFINYFREEQKYLHQYDIDVAPSFASLNSDERAWLTDLKMELYVPIMRYGEMMGLLAFGKKSKGTTYYPEDIDLMVALADQTVLAMESARLFQQLASINQEVDSLSEQLAGLDRNKSDFLSIASHELRTPLTHIHGYSRMLLDLTEEETRDISYVKTIVSGIAKGSERLKDIIDMMFDVTEANVGEMGLFLGPVNLEEVVSQASGPFLTALDERRIAFDKQGFAELPVIQADGGRLVQALENLLSNAIKYTPDGGVVRLKGATVVQDNIGSAVKIVVEDSGIGIDPEHHKQIFEKFYRIDDPDHHSTGRTKFKGAGPGLGLTLVKGIADAHGGAVWVESPGYNEETCPGSKFHFVLPLHPVTSPHEKTKQQKQSQIETVHWRSKDIEP